MTTAIVTEKNNTVVVREEPNRVIVTGIMGPPGTASVGGLQDIDLSNLTNGSVLVYKTNIQKWTSTTTLEDQYMNGGAF